MSSRVVFGLLCLFLGLTARAEVVDRTVAAVEKQIITLSDIRSERVIREALGEMSPEADRELLDDQRLVQTQLELYTQAEPTDVEVDQQTKQITDTKGLPVEAIRRRLRVQRFFMERFGQFITATDAEVQTYEARGPSQEMAGSNEENGQD